MKIRQITQAIEALAPLSLQENYDNAGLIVGNPNTEITQVLATLDITEAVIDEAIEHGCQLIIAHHPIIFRGLKSLTGSNYVERSIIKAIKHDVAIYAAHTNLDNAVGGVNTHIANKIGLINTSFIAPKMQALKKLVCFVPDKHLHKVQDAIFQAGAGHIPPYDQCSYTSAGTGSFRALQGSNPYVGRQGKQHLESETRLETIFDKQYQHQIVAAMQNAHPYEMIAYDIYTLDNQTSNSGSGIIGELAKAVPELEFLESLKKQFDVHTIKHTQLLNKPIKNVALCGGSGSFLLPKAIAAKADIYISADFKYHEYFDADKNILIADIGHYESEQYTKEIFVSYLNEKFPNFAVRLSAVQTNPVFYL